MDHPVKHATPYRRILATSVATVLVTALSSLAASIRWDILPGTAGPGDGTVTGGSGQGDTISGLWTADAGQTNVTWNNANNDEAVFGDGTGAINIAEPITAGALTFNSSDYILS